MAMPGLEVPSVASNRLRLGDPDGHLGWYKAEVLAVAADVATIRIKPRGLSLIAYALGISVEEVNPIGYLQRGTGQRFKYFFPAPDASQADLFAQFDPNVNYMLEVGDQVRIKSVSAKDGHWYGQQCHLVDIKDTLWGVIGFAFRKKDLQPEAPVNHTPPGEREEPMGEESSDAEPKGKPPPMLFYFSAAVPCYADELPGSASCEQPDSVRHRTARGWIEIPGPQQGPSFSAPFINKAIASFESAGQAALVFRMSKTGIGPYEEPIYQAHSMRPFSTAEALRMAFLPFEHPKGAKHPKSFLSMHMRLLPRQWLYVRMTLSLHAAVAMQEKVQRGWAAVGCEYSLALPDGQTPARVNLFFDAKVPPGILAHFTDAHAIEVRSAGTTTLVKGRRLGSEPTPDGGTRVFMSVYEDKDLGSIIDHMPVVNFNDCDPRQRFKGTAIPFASSDDEFLSYFRERLIRQIRGRTKASKVARTMLGLSTTEMEPGQDQRPPSQPPVEGVVHPVFDTAGVVEIDEPDSPVADLNESPKVHTSVPMPPELEQEGNCSPMQQGPTGTSEAVGTEESGASESVAAMDESEGRSQSPMAVSSAPSGHPIPSFCGWERPTQEQRRVMAATERLGEAPSNFVLYTSAAPGVGKTKTAVLSCLNYTLSKPDSLIAFEARTNFAVCGAYLSLCKARFVLAENEPPLATKIRPLRICSETYSGSMDSGNWPSYAPQPLHILVQEQQQRAESTDEVAFVGSVMTSMGYPHAHLDDERQAVASAFFKSSLQMQFKKETMKEKSQANQDETDPAEYKKRAVEICELGASMQKLDQEQRRALVKLIRPSIIFTTLDFGRYYTLQDLSLTPQVLVIDEASLLSRDWALWGVNQMGDSLEGLLLLGDRYQLEPYSAASGQLKALASVSALEGLSDYQPQRFRLHALPLSISWRCLPCMIKLYQKIYLQTLQSACRYETSAAVASQFPFPAKTCRVLGLQVAGIETRVQSVSNAMECAAVGDILNLLYHANVPHEDILVSSMYRGQHTALCYTTKQQRAACIGRGCADESSSPVMTVSSQIGREAPFVILSLTRSHQDPDPPNIGFSCDLGRMCVALSRASVGLFIIGNFVTFIHALYDILAKAKSKKTLHQAGTLLRILQSLVQDGQVLTGWESMVPALLEDKTRLSYDSSGRLDLTRFPGTVHLPQALVQPPSGFRDRSLSSTPSAAGSSSSSIPAKRGRFASRSRGGEYGRGREPSRSQRRSAARQQAFQGSSQMPPPSTDFRSRPRGRGQGPHRGSRTFYAGSVPVASGLPADTPSRPVLSQFPPLEQGVLQKSGGGGVGKSFFRSAFSSNQSTTFSLTAGQPQPPIPQRPSAESNESTLQVPIGPVALLPDPVPVQPTPTPPETRSGRGTGRRGSAAQRGGDGGRGGGPSRGRGRNRKR